MSAVRILLACVALALAGCSRDNAPSKPVAAAQQAQSAEAESTIDGVTVHVNALQTSQLPDSVARQYGIERSPSKVLLLVNVRGTDRGPAPVISATVTDLQGHATAVALRQVQVPQPGEPTIDYLGTVDITLPDTLRFAVDAKRDGSTATVRLDRDFYPQ